MDSRGFLWPSLVWRFLVSRMIGWVFMCCDALFTQKICLKGILKTPALHWLFLCLGFHKTWERSWPYHPYGPESDDCKPASESICMLWANIFNSRYLSSANSNWKLKKKSEIYDETRVIWRIKVDFRFLTRWFCAIFEFLYWSESSRRHYQEITWLWARPELCF